VKKSIHLISPPGMIWHPPLFLLLSLVLGPLSVPRTSMGVMPECDRPPVVMCQV
jgi:hypothetical protein